MRLAESYGLTATRVDTLAQLETTLSGAIARRGFHLIEVSMPDDFAGFR